MAKISKKVNEKEFREILKSNDGGIGVDVDVVDYESSKVIMSLRDFLEDDNLEDLQEIRRQMLANKDLMAHHNKYMETKINS